MENSHLKTLIIGCGNIAETYLRSQEYFNNMNMTQGSPLSSDLQTDYNNAKTNVNSILGITPTSQQFGYSAQPYGLLSSTNMTANPFNIDYLKKRGLI